MAAAPPSPRLPKAPCDGGGAPLFLFLSTDLDTHLALLVAPGTTIHGLKSLVAEEHAATFPELGPVAVKSFQVRRKGVLFHLSDSMTVTSAFTRIKGGCFLHVKMAEGAVAPRCSRDTLAINGRRPSDGCLGLHVEGHLQDLPATTSEIPSDVLTQRLEGGGDAAALNNVSSHDALPNGISLRSSSQLNIEIKNKTICGMNDKDAGCYPVINKEKNYSNKIEHANPTQGAYVNSTPMENVDKSSDQSNTSHIVEEVHAMKEDILHGVGDHDVDAGVSDNKHFRIEERMLEEIHAMDNLSQENEQNGSTTGCFDTSAADASRINNESDTRDGTKSSRAPLGTETTTHGEPLNTSSPLEIHDASHEESIQLENTSPVGKRKRKRKRHQLAPSKAASAQEITEISAVAAELPKSTGDNACGIDLTGRDETLMKASGLPLSSAELNDGNEGGKHFTSDAEASIDLLSEQEKLDRAAVYSTVVVSQGKVTKENSTHQDGGDKHEELKQLNEGSHDKGVAEASNIEKDGKSTNVLEKKQRNDNTSRSREKKHKKAKKISSVDMASTDATGEKEMHGHRENPAKSDIVSTEKDIVHGPSMQQISNNVHPGDLNVTENRSDDGKKTKKRRRHSESSKDVDASQDLTKSSGFVANESSIQCTVAAPLEAKQTTLGNIGATVDQKKLGASRDIEAQNLIDEVLAEIRSNESLSKDLDGDLLTGQTHLGINQSALEAPKSGGDKVGLSTALSPKYPAAVHPDAPNSSPRHKKSKGKKLKVLSTTIDSSHRTKGVPEEDGNTELKESCSLRFSDKTSDPKDNLSGDIVAQADDTLKVTKRQRKKPLKHVPIGNDKASDEQARQVAGMGLKEVNVAQTDFVQGGSTIDTNLSTVGKVEQKGRKSSKARTPRIQETNQIHGLDSHLVKESQYEYGTDIIGTHGNENAVGAPTKSPVAQKDATAHKSTSHDAQNEKKKSSNSEIQSHSALEHGSNADLVNTRTEKDMISPKSSADVVKPSDQIVVHPASVEINFLDHFSSSKMNDPSVSAGNKQNNEDGTLREMKGTGSIEPNDVLESLLPTNKTSLTDHSGISKAVAPSVAGENMNKEENVMDGKEKKKRKRKGNMEMASADKENPTSNNQGIDIGTQESHLSVVQKGRMGQDSGKERKPEELHRILENKLQWSDVDGYLNNVPAERDHVHISKEVRSSPSQTKPHAKSRNNDESIKGRMAPNPNTVNNLVKDFSMSPPATSDSTEGTPQNANRYRVAVRKVPSKRYEQTSEKSKKESMRVGPGAIFNDAMSEGSDDELETINENVVMDATPDTSADSGISSDESDVPDDGTVSLSQKSLKDGLRIGSILRGSSSYKKARQKQAEELDDDILVPDSQPDA